MEEEKEKKKRKKQLIKKYRRSKKGGVRLGFSKVTVTKILLILIVIITPISIYFYYNWYSKKQVFQYSFLTKGNEVYGTWINNDDLNFTHVITKFGISSTAEFLSLEFIDNFPFSTTLYQCSSASTFSSILGVPYDLHPHIHNDGVGDTYVDFTLLFLHDVPELALSLQRTGSFLYPAVLEWEYLLNGTDLGSNPDQNEYFFNPIMIVEPGNGELKVNTENEIHVTVNFTSGLYHKIDFSEISMVFTNTENITFSNPKILIGGLQQSMDRYVFISRLTNGFGPYSSMSLDFNITIFPNQTFTTKDILTAGGIFFQYHDTLLKSIYHDVGFGNLNVNFLGIPDENQIQALIYMIRLSFTNFYIDLPLEFECN